MSILHASEPYEHLDIRHEGEVIWATMNRPGSLNALNRRLVAELRDFYRQRRDAMQAALEEHFSDLADWQVPQGGLHWPVPATWPA